MISSMQSPKEGRPISGPSPLFCRKCGGGDLEYVGAREAKGGGGLLLHVLRCAACGWLWWVRP